MGCYNRRVIKYRRYLAHHTVRRCKRMYVTRYKWINRYKTKRVCRKFWVTRYRTFCRKCHRKGYRAPMTKCYNRRYSYRTRHPYKKAYNKCWNQVHRRWVNKPYPSIKRTCYNRRVRYLQRYPVKHCKTTKANRYCKDGCTTKCHATCSVTVYKHCNYRGYRINLKPGSYDMRTLMRKGMKNDDLSSIRVHGRCVARMYQHHHFGGKVLVKNRNDSCFTNDYMFPMSQLSQLVVHHADEKPELAQETSKAGSIFRGGSTVALRGGRGSRWCADEGHRVLCNRPWIKGWEKFAAVRVGSRVALRGGRGNRYCADEPHGVKCNRPWIKGWEKFYAHTLSARRVVHSRRRARRTSWNDQISSIKVYGGRRCYRRCRRCRRRLACSTQWRTKWAHKTVRKCYRRRVIKYRRYLAHHTVRRCKHFYVTRYKWIMRYKTKRVCRRFYVTRYRSICRWVHGHRCTTGFRSVRGGRGKAIPCSGHGGHGGVGTCLGRRQGGSRYGCRWK